MIIAVSSGMVSPPVRWLPVGYMARQYKLRVVYFSGLSLYICGCNPSTSLQKHKMTLSVSRLLSALFYSCSWCYLLAGVRYGCNAIRPVIALHDPSAGKAEYIARFTVAGVLTGYCIASVCWLSHLRASPGCQKS
jgi:hypothetical protein